MIKLRRYILLMLVLMTSINIFAQDADDDTGAKQGLKGLSSVMTPMPANPQIIIN